MFILFTSTLRVLSCIHVSMHALPRRKCFLTNDLVLSCGLGKHLLLCVRVDCGIDLQYDRSIDDTHIRQWRQWWHSRAIPGHQQDRLLEQWCEVCTHPGHQHLPSQMHRTSKISFKAIPPPRNILFAQLRTQPHLCE